jgi:tetratricopeptide (TPR) repeat protein
MMRRGVSYLLFVLLFVGLAASQEAGALIAEADGHYALRDDPGQALLAVSKYSKAADRDPGSYEARWKAAKALFFVGRGAANDKEKLRFFSEAVAQAKEAVRLGPESVEGHFWLAANLGEYGQARGVLKSLFLKNDIKRELDAAIRIDDRFDCGASYIAMGRIYYRAPRIFGGDLKRSRALLEKAREMCPRTTTTLLYLAETYWGLRERTLAIETLEELLAGEPYSTVLPEARRDRVEAEKLLMRYRED